MAKDTLGELPPRLNNLLTTLEEEQNKTPKLPEQSNDFSEFQRKNIPSPKEFGLVFDDIPLTSPSSSEKPQESSVDTESTNLFKEKLGFFKKIFIKNENLNTIQPSIEVSSPNEVKEEISIVIPDGEIKSEISLKQPTDTSLTVPKKSIKDPVIKNNIDKEINLAIKNIKRSKLKQTEAENMVVSLNKLKESLKQKEASLNEIRTELFNKAEQSNNAEILQKRKLNEADSKLINLKKLEDSVVLKEKKLNDSRNIYIKKDEETEELQKELKQKLILTDARLSELSKLKATFDDKQIKFSNTAKKLREILNHKESTLGANKQELLDKESVLTMSQNEIDSKLNDFEVNLSKLNIFENTLLEKENNLNQLKVNLLSKAKNLEVIEKDINKRLKEPELKLTELKKIKDSFEQKQEKLSQTTKNLSEKANDIKSAETILKEKLSDFELKSSQLKKLEDSLLQKEHDLNELKISLLSKAKTIEIIENDINEKLKEPEAKFAELKKLENKINEKQKRYEKLLIGIDSANLALKENRENYLIEKIKLTHEIESSLRLKTKLIMQKSKMLNSLNKGITSGKKALLEEEKNLAEKQAILKHKEAFLKSYNSRKKLIDLKQESLDRKEAVLNEKEESLKKLESTLLVKETELKDTKISLDKAMNSYSKEKEEVEDEEFKEYLHRKLSDISSKTESIKSVPVTTMDEPPKKHGKELKINTIIDECKKHISIRDFENAKKIYNQIRLEYYDVILPQDKKEELYNEIRAIYDDINLGLLSR